jgi:hypothetical protein
MSVARLGLLLFIVLGMGAAVAAFVARGTMTSAPGPVPRLADDLIVVELFTSQGCSSCPPANENLAALTRRSDILALSWGVTYWDQLGWPDTFADPTYTQRQRDYQRGLGTDNVWTPQIVVDGRNHVVGQRMAEIERLLRAHRTGTGPVIRFGANSQGVGLAGGSAPGQPADVWLVRYDPRIVEVPVRRGENGGRTLPHAHVVRQLVRLGPWTGQTVGYRLPPAALGLRTAILVQVPDGGPILSAAKG